MTGLSSVYGLVEVTFMSLAYNLCWFSASGCQKKGVVYSTKCRHVAVQRGKQDQNYLYNIAIISSNMCRVAIIFSNSMEENSCRGKKDADMQKDTAVTVRITSSLKTEQLKTAKKLKKEVWILWHFFFQLLFVWNVSHIWRCTHHLRNACWSQ